MVDWSIGLGLLRWREDAAVIAHSISIESTTDPNGGNRPTASKKMDTAGTFSIASEVARGSAWGALCAVNRSIDRASSTHHCARRSRPARRKHKPMMEPRARDPSCCLLLLLHFFFHNSCAVLWLLAGCSSVRAQWAARASEPPTHARTPHTLRPDSLVFEAKWARGGARFGDAAFRPPASKQAKTNIQPGSLSHQPTNQPTEQSNNQPTEQSNHITSSPTPPHTHRRH